jgi:hypothetical protein
MGRPEKTLVVSRRYDDGWTSERGEKPLFPARNRLDVSEIESQCLEDHPACCTTGNRSLSGGKGLERGAVNSTPSVTDFKWVGPVTVRVLACHGVNFPPGIEP